MLSTLYCIYPSDAVVAVLRMKEAGVGMTVSGSLWTLMRTGKQTVILPGLLHIFLKSFGLSCLDMLQHASVGGQSEFHLTAKVVLHVTSTLIL